MRQTSISMVTKCSLSPYSSTTLSKMGLSTRHGPQVGDVYSTLTSRSDSWYNFRSAYSPATSHRHRWMTLGLALSVGTQLTAPVQCALCVAK